MNRQYLATLRGRSCYPVFRGFVQFFVFVGFLVAIGLVLAGAMSTNASAIVISVAGAVLLVLVLCAIREASLMLADIADVAIDLGARGVDRQELFNPSDILPRPANLQR